MSGKSEFPDPGHVDSHVTPALDAFEEALRRRWRVEVAEAFSAGIDLPVRPSTWDPTSETSRSHAVRQDTYCEYLLWVDAGQKGALSAVRCDGVAVDAQGMSVEPVVCPVGKVLAEVETWANDEREELGKTLPKFDGNNIDRLQRARNDLKQVAKFLGQDYDAPVSVQDRKEGEESEPAPRHLAYTVTDMSGDNLSKDWWITWNGLAAANAKHGFFHWVGPTLHYQRNIAGCLANLYTLRAGIIELGRRNTLKAIDEATRKLDATVVRSNSFVGEWRTLQATGIALTIAPPTAPVGAAIVLAGFLGENLLPKGSFEEYANDMEGVLDGVKAKLADVVTDVLVAEDDYKDKVVSVQDRIAELPSSALELYDFTQNSATGDLEEQRESEFSVDVGDVLDLATSCYDAAEMYEAPLRRLIKVDDANADLRDKDGAETWGDKELIDLREALVSFLRTTCARYQEAGHRVRDTAVRYAESDADAVDQMESLEDHLRPGDGYWAQEDRDERRTVPRDERLPDLNGAAAGKGGDSADQVGGTDRGDIENGQEVDPYRGPKDDGLRHGLVP